MLTKEQCLSEELNPQSSVIDTSDIHLMDAILYAMNLWGEQCFNAAKLHNGSLSAEHPEIAAIDLGETYKTFELFLQSINQK